MKILVIGGFSPSLVNFRGHLLRSLVKRGHEVHAAAPGLRCDASTASRLREMGVQTHDIALRRTGTNPLKDLAALWSLWRTIRRIGADAVLGYTVKPVIWGTLAAAAAGVPRRFALITGLGYAFTGEATGRRRFVNLTVRVLYAVALAQVSKAFFQNGDDAALFRQLRLLPPSLPTVIVNGSGVDLEQFAPVALPGGPPSFLLIARLLGDKGIREFVAAAEQVRARHPDATFHLVGPIDSNPDAISPAELERWQASRTICWHGEESDVRPIIAASHVYVLPSYREGTPRTVLEAMAMSRPIITTDAPGCRETVVDGRNGFLVPPRSSDALAAAMLRMIEKPELIERMARESRHLAEEKYDVRKVSAAMIEEMGLG